LDARPENADLRIEWAPRVRRVPQVVQLAVELQHPLSRTLGQHYLRNLQQSHVAQGGLQKAHGDSPGQFSV